MSNDATATRRQAIASAIGIAGSGALAFVLGERIFGGGDPSVASTGEPANSPAAAGRQAERLAYTTTTTTTSPAVIVVPPPGPGQLLFPLQPTAECQVLDNFGHCRSHGPHEGIDILEQKGTPVVAVKGGVLDEIYTNTGAAGFGWRLRGDDGVLYRYFHLDSFAERMPGVALQKGDRVAYAQVIGYVGSTGTGSDTNDHLHFEVRVGYSSTNTRGTAIDPLPLLAVPDGIPVFEPPNVCI
jgi:murein DD-endopeptidase MepM/ murein hydrolase activator NlpD